jgi:hypothetical protein
VNNSNPHKYEPKDTTSLRPANIPGSSLRVALPTGSLNPRPNHSIHSTNETIFLQEAHKYLIPGTIPTNTASIAIDIIDNDRFHHYQSLIQQ